MPGRMQDDVQWRICACLLRMEHQECVPLGLSLAKTPSALPHNDLRHLAESVPYSRITDSKDQERSEAGDSVAGVERLRCQPFDHADTCQ